MVESPKSIGLVYHGRSNSITCQLLIGPQTVQTCSLRAFGVRSETCPSRGRSPALGAAGTSARTAEVQAEALGQDGASRDQKLEVMGPRVGQHNGLNVAILSLCTLAEQALRSPGASNQVRGTTSTCRHRASPACRHSAQDLRRVRSVESLEAAALPSCFIRCQVSWPLHSGAAFTPLPFKMRASNLAKRICRACRKQAAFQRRTHDTRLLHHLGKLLSHQLPGQMDQEKRQELVKLVVSAGSEDCSAR